MQSGTLLASSDVMRKCSTRFLPLLALSPALLAALVACERESGEPDVTSGEAGASGAHSSQPDAGKPGNEPPLAGAGGETGQPEGSGGVGGETGQHEGSGGVAGDPGLGSCGNGGEVAGAGGESGEISCTNVDGSCAEPCHEVQVVSGCGDDQQRAILCSMRPAPETTACGVRLADDQVFYVDAPHESSEYVIENPFAASEGFRACTQAEVDASDCRDLSDTASVRSARFVLENTTEEDRWVLIEGEPCGAFDVKKAGVSLQLESGSACADSACNSLSSDWITTETWERIPAGQSITLSWDGLELASFHAIDVCEPELNPDETAQPGDGRCIETSARAAAAGAFAATFGVRSTDPSLHEGAECEGERCEVPLDIAPVRAVYPACRTSGPDTLDVPFELPETGEAVVTVSLE